MMCHRKRAGEIKGIKGVLVYIWCNGESTDIKFFMKVN